MGAFRDLLVEARRRGARLVHFDVDLKDFLASDENESWRCEIDDGRDVRLGNGRTGEEALRRSVEQMEEKC